MNSSKPFRVLLYYFYTRIDDPAAYAQLHLAFCKALGVKGRILIAAEGINGTISGTVDQTDAYMHAMHMDPRFAGMIFKIDAVDDHVFKKIFVRHRDEIVTLGLDEELDPNEITGKHLDPEDFLRELQSDDVIIIDARNDYEYDLGHFRNAIRPNVRAFKEFPQWVRENLANQKQKKILTYCTGGIRCEKFTAFLMKEGFSDVSQLHGGIINYAQDATAQGKMFDGRCYVFDERVSVPVNQAEGAALVSYCRHCGAASDRYVNCANLDCDIQFFCCEQCEHPHRRSCSEECAHAPRHEYSPEISGHDYSFYR